MENKKIRFLISLIVVFIILVAFCFIKNEDTKEKINEEYIKNEQKQDDNEEVLNEEEQDIANILYDMIKINDVRTENLDYYLNDKITINNISEELLSYLVIKNLDVDKTEDYIDIKYEEVEKIHNKVFGNSDLISTKYKAIIGKYEYSLEFFVELNTYILTKEEVNMYDYKKDSKIISNVIKEDNIIITEEFKLYLDKSGNPTNKGLIKYTFTKVDNGEYYLNSIERLNS